jgi:hypothetical protein
MSAVGAEGWLGLALVACVAGSRAAHHRAALWLVLGAAAFVLSASSPLVRARVPPEARMILPATAAVRVFSRRRRGEG